MHASWLNQQFFYWIGFIPKPNVCSTRNQKIKIWNRTKDDDWLTLTNNVLWHYNKDSLFVAMRTATARLSECVCSFVSMWLCITSMRSFDGVLVYMQVFTDVCTLHFTFHTLINQSLRSFSVFTGMLLLLYYQNKLTSWWSKYDTKQTSRRDGGMIWI